MPIAAACAGVAGVAFPLVLEADAAIAGACD